MNICLTTKEFNDIAVEGMRFQCVYNQNEFDSYPFELNEIVTYIETLNDCYDGYCNKFTIGQCKGHGIFKRSDGRTVEMCMSWKLNMKSVKLGYTHLIEYNENFIEEDEMII